MSLDFSLVGALGQAASSLFTGFSQSNLASYQGSAAQLEAQLNAQLTALQTEYSVAMTTMDTNARIALLERQIVETHQIADLNVEAEQRSSAKTLGTQRAALGASGVVIDAGSGMDVQRDTMATEERNIALIRYGEDINSQDLQTSADLEKRRGRLLASMYQTLGDFRESSLLTSGDVRAEYDDMLGSSYLAQGLMGAATSGTKYVLDSKSTGGKA